MGKYIAELIGTFALVFCGTGAIIVDSVSDGQLGNVGIAITFGLIISAMIYSLGERSGAHFNPAVTIGFFFAGRFPGKTVVPYITAQLIGALLASAILYFLFPDSETMGETLPSGSNMQTFVMEIILTFFLMFVIISVSTGSKEVGHMAALAVGATVLLEAMFAGPITGASMNPARSIAPAIFQQEYHTLWIYILAPIIGSILAIIAWKLMDRNTVREKY